VRLLTWNVQWCRGVDGKVDPARIAREARRLCDPDVICLQEISVGFTDLPGTSGEDQVAALERELPEYTFFFVAGVDIPGPGGRNRFGNLVASRLPVGRVLRHSLPWPPTESPSMPRSAVEVVVQAEFGPVRVTTTHLEYYSNRHRTAQIERLLELHGGTNREEARGENEGPYRLQARPANGIVCGDFNLPPHDPLHARFSQTFADAWQALHPGKPHPHTFRVHERDKEQAPYCCDFVFVSPDLAPRLRTIAIDGANQASDHQPVSVELL
jgi:endonuclease/exonuclease/phosphatase family metal-dependent hydrolase